MEATSTALRIGDTIGGCRIAGFIGSGGMGSVYEAVQVSLERRVAIKVLHRENALDEADRRERFLR